VNIAISHIWGFDDVAQSPATNYYKDIPWLHKANPLASGAEKSFYD
jgi:hypothetical protein